MRGASSALYGADAMGGVINIITKTPSEPIAKISLSYGRSDTKNLILSTSRKIGKFGYLFSASAEDSSGFRENSDYEMVAVDGKFVFDFSDSFKVDFNYDYSCKDAGSPGLEGYPTLEARLKNENSLLGITFRIKDSTLKIYSHNSKIHYNDPEYFIDDTHKNNIYGADFQNGLRVGRANLLTWGIELIDEGLDSTSIGSKTRTRKGIFIQDEISPGEKLSIIFGARYDDFSTGSQFCPKASMLFKATETTSLRFSTGKGYRIPTLNDLYWPYNEIMPEDVIASLDENLSGPCTTEMASFDRFMDFMEGDEYDVIIFDTAPTGHTIRLLELPVDWSKHIEESAQGSGQTCLGPVQSIQDSKDKYDRATSLLKDPERTSFIFVMRPEDLSLYETVRAAKELETIGIKSGEIIINGILPEEVCEIEFFRKKYEAQQRVIRDMERAINKPKRYMLLRDSEVKGIGALRDVAEELFNSPLSRGVRGVFPSLEKRGEGRFYDKKIIPLNPPLQKGEINNLLLPANGTKAIFFTGKGGVGKTTISCIAAIYAAQKGLKTLLVTTDPAAHIGKIYERWCLMISIIIPTLNEETTLEKTIKSVSSANVEHEFIIVDAESTDNTRPVANRYGKVLNISKHSRGASLDLGAQNASGNILLFLHADTQMPDGALEKIQKYMDNPQIVWGGFKRCLNPPAWKYRLLDLWVMFYNRVFKIIAGDQGIFCRKDIFLNIGGFMGMPIFEDVNLSSRLRKSGKMILIKNCIHVSTRRYEKAGILKISFLNLLLTFFYICGISPDRIYQIYYRKFRKKS